MFIANKKERKIRKEEEGSCARSHGIMAQMAVSQFALLHRIFRNKWPKALVRASTGTSPVKARPLAVMIVITDGASVPNATLRSTEVSLLLQAHNWLTLYRCWPCSSQQWLKLKFQAYWFPWQYRERVFGTECHKPGFESVPRPCNKSSKWLNGTNAPAVIVVTRKALHTESYPVISIAFETDKLARTVTLLQNVDVTGIMYFLTHEPTISTTNPFTLEN